MSYRVAVVGATGAVGTVMRVKLRERGFPAAEVVPFASERSVGKELDGVPCRALSDESIQGFDLALFSAGASTSGEWAPRFVEAGTMVVDNSSKWRRDPEVPLVRMTLDVRADVDLFEAARKQLSGFRPPGGGQPPAPPRPPGR